MATIIIGLKMTTDEEKSKITKLLQGIEVQEIRLPERCSDLIKEFHKKFGKEVEDEKYEMESATYENPYRPNTQLLEENERKLRELLIESKRVKKEIPEKVIQTVADPKRPWRTHSNKEKLHRIDSELKQHLERSTQLLVPMPEIEMKDLVKECQAETNVAPPVERVRLQDTVEAAKKNLPNFQFRKISNSTATSIMLAAHDLDPKIQDDEDKTATEI